MPIHSLHSTIQFMLRLASTVSIFFPLLLFWLPMWFSSQIVYIFGWFWFKNSTTIKHSDIKISFLLIASLLINAECPFCFPKFDLEHVGRHARQLHYCAHRVDLSTISCAEKRFSRVFMIATAKKTEFHGHSTLGEHLCIQDQFYKCYSFQSTTHALWQRHRPIVWIPNFIRPSFSIFSFNDGKFSFKFFFSAFLIYIPDLMKNFLTRLNIPSFL